MTAPNGVSRLAVTGTSFGGPTLTSKEKVRKAENSDECDESSITRSYHRQRAEELAVYIKDLSEDDKEKLKVDARRIEASRDRLKKSDESKSLLVQVQQNFDQWRLAAQEAGVKFKYSVTERDRHFKDLSFVETDGRSGHDQAMKDLDDPSHDFRVGFLFFEKHGIGWKKTDYDGPCFDKHSKFPDQKLTFHDALFAKNMTRLQKLEISKEGGI